MYPGARPGHLPSCESQRNGPVKGSNTAESPRPCTAPGNCEPTGHRTRRAHRLTASRFGMDVVRREHLKRWVAGVRRDHGFPRIGGAPGLRVAITATSEPDPLHDLHAVVGDGPHQGEGSDAPAPGARAATLKTTGFDSNGPDWPPHEADVTRRVRLVTPACQRMTTEHPMSPYVSPGRFRAAPASKCQTEGLNTPGVAAIAASLRWPEMSTYL